MLEYDTGYQEYYGVTKKKNILSFSLQAPEHAICNLLLYPRDGEQVQRIPMHPSENCDTVYRTELCGLEWKKYDYNFEINGKEQNDVYARWISGREVWAEERRRPMERRAEEFIPEKIRRQRMEKREIKIKTKFYFSNFRWKEDTLPRVKKEDMVIYKLHARGFSMGMHTEDRWKGTFGAIEHKLDYFQKLGVTTLMFLPVYEFEEFLVLDESKWEEHPQNMINYWGYAEGSYFAPKASYLGKGNTPDVFKHFIQKLHERNMECILEFYFDKKINPHLIIAVLRYWRKEYHVDGFKVNCSYPMAQLLAMDSRLGGCKLFYEGFEEGFAADTSRLGPELYAYNDGFLYGVRRMMNHQGGSIYEFVCQMRRQQEKQGFVNYVAENNGFSLADLFSYAQKHNEENQEENQDGTDWNYSMNCGAEGATRKKSIQQERKRRMKNALAVTFLSQGIPLVWMGDECANTQEGNNNAYCQDNAVGWKDWKNLSLNRQILEFTSQLARLRRECPLLHGPLPFRMSDYENRGCPDLSYHSDGCWNIDFDRNRSFVGIYYSGEYSGKESFYAAFNFQDFSQKFALPAGKEWKVLLNTAAEPSIPGQPVGLGAVREFLAEGNSVCLLSGVPAKEEKRGGRRSAKSSD